MALSDAINNLLGRWRRLAFNWASATNSMPESDDVRQRAQIRADAYRDCANDLEEMWRLFRAHGSNSDTRQLEAERDEARRIAEAYREVVDKVNAAVDETPNPDPLPWICAKMSKQNT